MATPLDEQLAAAQAKVARLKERQKKLETRKKIVIGATVISHFSDDELRKFLDEKLTRKDDRELFGLPEKINKRDTRQTINAPPMDPFDIENI